MRLRVYRFVHFPASPHEDLHVAALQAGPEAVISHDSDLALYDLSDRLPDQVHVTIPRTASRWRPGLKLHTNRLKPEDVTRYKALPVTTVSRTLVEVATAGLAEEQVRQAIREALRRGLVSWESLLRRATSHGGRIKRLVEETFVFLVCRRDTGPGRHNHAGPGEYDPESVGAGSQVEDHLALRAASIYSELVK